MRVTLSSSHGMCDLSPGGLLYLLYRAVPLYRMFLLYLLYPVHGTATLCVYAVPLLYLLYRCCTAAVPAVPLLYRCTCCTA